MPDCLIGLGSNLGDRAAVLDHAVGALGQEPRIRVTATSRWIETAAIGGPQGQGPYLNGALRLETDLDADALLDVLQRIENDAGRTRDVRWGPRTLDLDLLLYGDTVQSTPRLTIPHPRMAFRRFVLEPAAAVAADMVHAPTGWTVARLWRHLNESPNYVAVAGPPCDDKCRLANALCEPLGAKLIPGDEIPLLLGLSLGSPSRVWRATIEFLQGWSDVLGQIETSDRTRFVSDFWFDELPLWIRPALTTEQFQEFLGRFEERRKAVSAPKLTILFGGESDAETVGPTLPFSTDTWDTSLSEALAATAGMID